MILSVSRRTDIPAFYSEWFINRIIEGFVYVRNPFNYNQVSKINISPDNVDCIVFWSKNPKPIIEKLNILDELNYKYYFQFTINPYEKDLEKSIVSKEDIINTFINLSNLIGKKRVVLRYDPILLNEKYDINYHIKAFDKLCTTLYQHTEKITFSFLDDYKKVKRNMSDINIKEITEDDMLQIAHKFKEITNKHGLLIETCAEEIDLNKVGINHGKCIDGDLIESIIGYEIKNKNKLDGNRQYCGCMKTIDIGQYDSCIHNCLYCYANINKAKALTNYINHNPNSPILFGDYDIENVKERKDVQSYKIIKDNEQISLF